MSACVVTFLKITTPMGGVIELTNASVQGAMDLLNAINGGVNEMKMKLFAHIWKSDRNLENPAIILFSIEHKENYYICLGETEVSFDCPPMPSDEELTNRQIDYLRKGREETVKEFTTKLSNIDEQISELLALPCLETE